MAGRQAAPLLLTVVNFENMLRFSATSRPASVWSVGLAIVSTKRALPVSECMDSLGEVAAVQ